MPSTDDQAARIQPVTMTYDEAAQYLGVSPRTVRRLVADGSLRHVPIPGRGEGVKLVRIRREDLDAYLDAVARGGKPRSG